MADTETLAGIRAELDALDDEMHALLMRRAATVARLAASAAKPNGTVLRPGREAAILRRLLRRHEGNLPRAALVRIWREIFAASVAQQGGFSVAVPPDPALARLAAEHFGTGTPLRPQPSLAAALSAVAGGGTAAALLPWPREGEAEEEAWWTRFDAQQLQVIARLPFLHPGEPPLEAAVVALNPADASGHDRVLFRLEAPEESRAAIAARHPGARVLIARREAGMTRALLEAETAPPGAAVLGRYALPERGAA
ncbi:chorismate mutase [Sabulicella rubraurantiaca]|uniref:chorismate mutase n=1 Tax=Sabulicella rubraurantiaca TaxID=2811429 RepID=UPI001A97A597|nr:chorismate mutase [Sabulicella rubraurantiaca]